jgi:carboxypeptidase Taq
MGNVISYQIWNSLRKDLGDTDQLMRDGQFGEIRDWLIEKIYRKARQQKPKDLLIEVTGRAIDPTDYLDGLGAKYTRLYGL